MSHVTRKHKPGCTATEDGLRLNILDLGSRAVTAQLISAFVFAYAKRRFSHDKAHMLRVSIRIIALSSKTILTDTQ